jgi:ParB family chromosome partitioning protein
MRDELGMRQRAIAEAVGRSQPAVAKALGLLDLPEDVRERVRGGELTAAHAVALAPFKPFPAAASAMARWRIPSSSRIRA